MDKCACYPDALKTDAKQCRKHFEPLMVGINSNINGEALAMCASGLAADSLVVLLAPAGGNDCESTFRRLPSAVEHFDKLGRDRVKSASTPTGPRLFGKVVHQASGSLSGVYSANLADSAT